MDPEHPHNSKNKLENYQIAMEAEQQRRNIEIELKLSMSTPFRPNDPKQSFYRKIDNYPEKYLIIKRLGWKIKDLSREQQELAMLCFNLLAN